MIGQRIKECIEKSRYSLPEVAQKLGTTTQNMYKIFSKESVQTNILEKLSAVLDIPVTGFFEEKLTVDMECSEKIEKLSKENEELKIKINDLLSQIRYMHRDLEDKRNLIDFLRKNNLILQFDTFLALTEPDVEKRTELKRLIIYGGDPRIADEFDKKFETFKKDYWKNISDHFISEENTKSKSK